MTNEDVPIQMWLSSSRRVRPLGNSRSLARSWALAGHFSAPARGHLLSGYEGRRAAKRACTWCPNGFPVRVADLLGTSRTMAERCCHSRSGLRLRPRGGHRCGYGGGDIGPAPASPSGSVRGGPRRVRGTLGFEGLIEDVIRQGQERGLEPGEIAAEVTAAADVAIRAPAATAVAEAQSPIVQAVDVAWSNLSCRLWEERVARMAQFERETASLVGEMAKRHGWSVIQHPRNPNPAGVARRPDLLIKTADKSVVVELKMGLDRNRLILESLKRTDEVHDFGARAGLLVVPDDTNVTPPNRPEVEVVRARELEHRLAALLG
jgi:hypothetical protein